MAGKSGKIQREGYRFSDMLKVCSYRRSGTHYLMALLAANFKFKENLEQVASTEYGNKWVQSGKDCENVPWGKLFGTHSVHNATEHRHLLYIYRHPVDVMRSLWEFHGKPGTLTEFVTPEKIRDWKRHVSSYIDANVYSVRYDQLCATPISVLDGIRKRFELKLIDGEFHPVKERVGWKEKAKMAETEGYRTETLDIFSEVLGHSYRGFKI